METRKPKIAFYVKRTFGEKLGATFDFIKENWKLLLKFTTYLLLPLCLIQALSLNGMMGGIVGAKAMVEAYGIIGNSDGELIWNFVSYYILYMFLNVLGTVLLMSLIYAMIRMYNDREERLQGVTLGMLKSLLFRNMKRLFLMVLVGLLLVAIASIVLGVASVVVPPMLFLIIPLVIAVVVALALWAPIYLFEEIGLLEALKKAFRLGFATWGGIFGVVFILGLVGGILQGVTMMPWYLGIMVKTLLTMSDSGGGFTDSTGYNFMLYLLAVVQGFGAYLSMIFSITGLAYQYGHASEKVDNVTVESDIDNFDKL